MATVTAPVRLIWEVCIAPRYPFGSPQVVGRFTPRIDYPGGIEAFAAVVWDSVMGLTGNEDTRYVRIMSR